MKRAIITGFLLLTLTGCAAAETFETLGDVYGGQASIAPASTSFLLPEDAASPVFRGESGRLYFCEGYEIMVETLASGDLNRTVTTLTGYGVDSLTILQTDDTNPKRYECVWTAAGEGGDQVGRTVILDDGNYHYCISLTALAEDAGSLQESWQEVLSSFKIQS